MQKMAALGCVGLVLVIGVIVLLVGIGGYNGLNKSSYDVDTKWANVQAQYQRRSDLIDNLVRTVQGSANFEKSTLTDVINARANATKVTIDPSHAPTDPAQLAAYQKSQDSLTGSLSRLLVSVEKYPELKSTQGFRDLQAQIEGTENRIAVSRIDFNTSAQAYNTTRHSFPTVLYADAVGFHEKPPFKADEAAQTAPKVDFGSFGTTPAPPPPRTKGSADTRFPRENEQADLPSPAVAAAVAADRLRLWRRPGGARRRGHSAGAYRLF